MVIFYHHNGATSPHPTDRDAARRLRKSKYDDGVKCPTCESRPSGNSCSIKYTANGRCIHCCRLEAISFHATAAAGLEWPEGVPITDDMRIAASLYPIDIPGHLFPDSPSKAVAVGSDVYLSVEPCPKAGHIGVRIASTRECWFCHRDKESKQPRIDARRAGDTWYTPSVPCPDCGMLADRRVHDDQCSNCESSGRSMSPRQAAIASGDKWYIPDKPCKACGTKALRHVDNGRCQGCRASPHTTGIDDASRVMHDIPDIVISRSDARLAGFTVYRTGRPCRHGHTGWRYVSTGGCIDCLRG